MSGPAALLLASLAIPVVGLLAAALARLVVGRWRATRLGWAASTLCGIVGASVGSACTALAIGRPLREVPVAVIAGGLAGAIAVLLLADVVARRLSPATPSANALIQQGESDRVEFKSSARFNRHTEARDARLELVIATSVAGFFNARGGTLLIGVTDDGRAVGLREDYQLVKKADRDGYELWLRDLFMTTLGAPAAGAVHISFEQVDGHDVCLVQVPPAPRPVFVRTPKQRSSEFAVRVGNSTCVLAAHELLDYASTRWPRRPLARRNGARRFEHDAVRE